MEFRSLRIDMDDAVEALPWIMKGGIGFDKDLEGYKPGRIGLLLVGLYEGFSIASHEMGHVVDFMLRRRPQRLKQRNFGLSYQSTEIIDGEPYPTMKTTAPIDAEMRAVAIEYHMVKKVVPAINYKEYRSHYSGLMSYVDTGDMCKTITGKHYHEYAADKLDQTIPLYNLEMIKEAWLETARLRFPQKG